MADILLPEPSEGYEYIIIPKRKEMLVQLREERDRLKAELDLMTEPSNENLRELGKSIHYYYVTERKLDIIKNEINKLSK